MRLFKFIIGQRFAKSDVLGLTRRGLGLHHLGADALSFSALPHFFPSFHTARCALLGGAVVTILAVALPDGRPRAQVIGGQRVDGSGNILTLTNPTIETNDGTIGAQASNGGLFVLNGGSVTTGTQAKGLQALYQGAKIEASDLTINTGAAPGAVANTDGVVRLTGGRIETHGSHAFGVWSLGNGAEVTVNGTTIITHGDSATGAEYSGSGRTAYGSGLMTLSDVNITTYGIRAYGAAQSATFSPAPGGSPVLTPTPTTLIMNGGTITTYGRQTAGLFGNVSTLSRLSDVRINTFGEQGFGVEAQWSGRVYLTNVSIATTGMAGLGIYALGASNDNPAWVSGSNVNILTKGTSAYGLFVQGLARIDLNNSTVITQGVGAAVLSSRSFLSIGNPAVSGPSTVNISNSTLIAEQSDGIVVTGSGAQDPLSTLNATLTNSILTSNTGAWLVAQTVGGNTVVANVVADHSRLTGSARTNPGSISEVMLKNTSAWTMTGSSNLTTLVNEASTVIFAAPTGDPALLSSYKTLTNKNYTGSGGAIRLNTFLGTDASPAYRLVIHGGRATGSTSLVVMQTGGAGALTSGDGILVVNAVNGATTAPNAFSLGNRVGAGAYEYRLFYGGRAVSGGNPSNQNWYLRSAVDLTPEPPVVPPGLPAPGTSSPGPGVSDREVPNYRLEVPVDMAVPALASRLGLVMLGTYHDRVGEELPSPQATVPIWCKDSIRNFRCLSSPGENAAYVDAASGEGRRRSAAWGRVFGETGSVGYGGRYSLARLGKFEQNGPSYEFGLSGVQLGMDVYRTLRVDGTHDIAGLYFGVGRIEADVKAALGGKAGTTEMNSYSLGGYWTRKGASGWYLDAVVQGTWYDDVKARSLFGETLKTDGFGFIASLERVIRSRSAPAGQSSRRHS
jgi:hypothetical protein